MKLIDCIPQKTADRINHTVELLREAGLQEGATIFECNYCGETFPVSEAFPAMRGGVPVIVCSDDRFRDEVTLTI